MAMSSTVQVLKINPVESGKSAKTGKDWERHTAECIILDDDGAIDCVGRLVIPTPLRESIKVGTFRASFSLRVPTYGDTKGDIQAMLTGLMPVPMKGSPLPPSGPSALSKPATV